MDYSTMSLRQIAQEIYKDLLQAERIRINSQFIEWPVPLQPDGNTFFPGPLYVLNIHQVEFLILLLGLADGAVVGVQGMCLDSILRRQISHYGFAVRLCKAQVQNPQTSS